MLRGFWVVLVHLVMGEWAVGQWIVGVTSFQKIYGLYSVEHHKVEIWSYYGGRGGSFVGMVGLCG